MAELLYLWDYVQRDLILGADQNYTDDPIEFTEICYPLLPEDQFKLWVVIPAFVCTLILAFTQKRKIIKRTCLNGRPGLIHPMDVLSRSHRFSYAAAFGILSNLCYTVIVDQKYAFQYDGPTYLKVFIVLLTMLIYGVTYFPLFAAFSVQNSLGYFIGTLFSWTFAAVYISNTLVCTYSAINYLTLFINEAPIILCHLYLIISLPFRFVWSFKRKRKLKFAVDFDSSDDLYDSIRNSYQGIHVRKLYAKPPPPLSPPVGFCPKVIHLVKTTFQKVVYKRENNFRYSTRMVSVLTVSFIVIYNITVGSIRVIVWLTGEMMKMIDKGIDYVNYLTFLRGYEQEATELLNAAKYTVFTARVILLITLPLTFVIGVVMIVHTLANYRYLLRNLYKRNYCHLTPREEIGNSSSLVGSMRYAGYQVGYIVWGYLIQFIVLTLVATIITAVIQLWPYLNSWIIDKLHALWPVLLTSLVVNFIQLLLAKFFFLHDNGNQLAIDNRRLFFIITYFMFFYNIFIGLVSCLLRILKSIVLGSLFIPRLDHSTLPRKFQRFDPGFHAFCGFMHVESAHSHPVVMVFISILQAESFNTLKANSEKPSLKSMMGKSITTMNGTYEMDMSRKSRKAKWKWLLAYTLIQNPTLCLERKIALAKQKNESIIMSVLQDNYEAVAGDEKISIHI